MALAPLPPEVIERTIPAVLAGAVREAPEHVAIVAAHHALGELSLTYRELAERAARLAGALAERGVGHGERVAILLDPDAAADAHVVLHAAHHLGAIAVPLNARYVARELRYVLGFADPAAVVFSPRFAPVIEEMHREISRAGLLEAATEPLLGEPLEDVLQRSSPVPEAPVDETGDADWLFTSGTTGNPKAVALTHANSVACGTQAVPLWGLDAGSVYQSAAPFFTSTASHTNLLACLTARCTYVVEPVFDARETLDRVRRHGTTSVFWVSPMLALMLERVPEAEIEAALRGTSLRRLVYGGQLMDRSFYERVHRLFGDRLGLEIAHVYGLTEGGTSGTFLRPEYHADAVRHVRASGLSIGEAFHPWVGVRVLDEQDREVGANEVGELCLSGPSIMRGYVADEDATRMALRGGWLRTGDMAMRDDAGYLYMVDRKKQMIRRGALDISSTEVEAVLLEHPAITEAAAFAIPNPVLGEDVAAAVAVRDGAVADAEAVLAHCRERLADYKVPRAVHFLDALPRNAMGRVVKPELSERFARPPA